MRTEVLNWWGSLSFEERWYKIVEGKNFIDDYPYCNPNTLTVNEIEKLYENTNR